MYKGDTVSEVSEQCGKYTIDQEEGTVTYIPAPKFTGLATTVTIIGKLGNMEASWSYQPVVAGDIITVTRTINYIFNDEKTSVKESDTQTLVFSRAYDVEPDGKWTNPTSWKIYDRSSDEEIVSPDKEAVGWDASKSHVPSLESDYTTDDGSLKQDLIDKLDENSDITLDAVTVVYTPRPPKAEDASSKNDEDELGSMFKSQRVTPKFEVQTSTTPDGENKMVRYVMVELTADGEKVYEHNEPVSYYNDKGEKIGTFEFLGSENSATVEFTPEEGVMGEEIASVTVRGYDANGQYADAVYTVSNFPKPVTDLIMSVDGKEVSQEDTLEITKDSEAELCLQADGDVKGYTVRLVHGMMADVIAPKQNDQGEEYYPIIGQNMEYGETYTVQVVAEPWSGDTINESVNFKLKTTPVKIKNISLDGKEMADNSAENPLQVLQDVHHVTITWEADGDVGSYDVHVFVDGEEPENLCATEQNSMLQPTGDQKAEYILLRENMELGQVYEVQITVTSSTGGESDTERMFFERKPISVNSVGIEPSNSSEDKVESPEEGIVWEIPKNGSRKFVFMPDGDVESYTVSLYKGEEFTPFHQDTREDNSFVVNYEDKEKEYKLALGEVYTIRVEAKPWDGDVKRASAEFRLQAEEIKNLTVNGKENPEPISLEKGDDFVLTWTAEGDVKEYRVTLSDDSGAEPIERTYDPQGVLTQSIGKNHFAPGTNYTVTVEAIPYYEDLSTLSKTVSIRVKTIAPENLTAQVENENANETNGVWLLDQNASEITLAFAADGDVAGYEVNVADLPEGATIIEDSRDGKLVYTISVGDDKKLRNVLTVGKTYTGTVTAKAYGEGEDQTQTFSFAVQPTPVTAFSARVEGSGVVEKRNYWALPRNGEPTLKWDLIGDAEVVPQSDEGIVTKIDDDYRIDVSAMQPDRVYTVTFNVSTYDYGSIEGEAQNPQQQRIEVEGVYMPLLKGLPTGALVVLLLLLIGGFVTLLILLVRRPKVDPQREDLFAGESIKSIRSTDDRHRAGENTMRRYR